jgi:Protein of unknown function (DUF2812).
MEKKNIWFSIFRVVVPANYEKMLEDLSLEGWNISKISQLSSFKLTLERSSPKKYKYIYDVRFKDLNKYRNSYKYSGWELIGQMANCFIWRKEYSDICPVFFSNTDSIINRNKRFRATIIALLIIISIVILFCFLGIFAYIRIKNCGAVNATMLKAGLALCISFYLIYVLREINLNIER